MAVCVEHPVDDEHAAPVDRGSVDERTFGVRLARRHAEYVFGVRGVSCVVHRVRRVEMHWYRHAGMRTLVKLKRPVLIAETFCLQSFRLEPGVARMCLAPAADALPCGRCAGARATFPWSAGGRSRFGGALTRQEAHVRLGCAVPGY